MIDNIFSGVTYIVIFIVIHYLYKCYCEKVSPKTIIDDMYIIFLSKLHGVRIQTVWSKDMWVATVFRADEKLGVGRSDFRAGLAARKAIDQHRFGLST